MKAFFTDEFNGFPLKRALAQVIKKREAGAKVIGNYCAYAPLEIIHAMNGAPAVLCAFSNGTIAGAEATLPTNLCPLIKSSYGFIQAKTCPFFELTDAVVGETTCDGKKKMFELIGDKRPLIIMDLPQQPDSEDAIQYWEKSLHKFKAFLEKIFSVEISNTKLERAMHDSNKKNALVMQILDYARFVPSVISWQEMYDVASLAQVCRGPEIEDKLKEIIIILEERTKNGEHVGKAGAPRVLVTGCPVGGDVFKVLRTIEEEGGVIVGMDSCTGRKPFVHQFKEKTGNPMRAIAERYLQIPCSCMTPNTKRLSELAAQIEMFKPDLVVDLVLQACHTYNVESVRIERHVREQFQLPFLKVVTDFSPEDLGQLKTRIGAALEMTR